LRRHEEEEEQEQKEKKKSVIRQCMGAFRIKLILVKQVLWVRDLHTATTVLAFPNGDPEPLTGDCHVKHGC
jgi:hypothetical protein